MNFKKVNWEIEALNLDRYQSQNLRTISTIREQFANQSPIHRSVEVKWSMDAIILLPLLPFNKDYFWTIRVEITMIKIHKNDNNFYRFLIKKISMKLLKVGTYFIHHSYRKFQVGKYVGALEPENIVTW